jgi:hypothetical protein
MTAKKNESDEIRNEYAPEEAFSFRRWIAQNLFVLAGVTMAIVNIWLSSKLFPLVQGISELTHRVNAVETKLADTPTREEFTLIIGRLDRIQNSLNDLIQLHLVK